MGEFGHTAISTSCWHVDSWGTGPFLITWLGKTYRFEDSDRFGPAPVLKNGDIAAAGCFPDGSQFWRAHKAWVAGGRKVAEDGVTCILPEDRDGPTAIAAIVRAMEERGWKQAHLVPFIGSGAKVSEVLAGKRSLSKSMIQRLHKGLNIPLDVLLNQEAA